MIGFMLQFASMTVLKFVGWCGQRTLSRIAAGHVVSRPVCRSVRIAFTELIIQGTISICSAAMQVERATVETSAL